jgi:hypothetical protein
MWPFGHGLELSYFFKPSSVASFLVGIALFYLAVAFFSTLFFENAREGGGDPLFTATPTCRFAGGWGVGVGIF